MFFCRLLSAIVHKTIGNLLESAAAVAKGFRQGQGRGREGREKGGRRRKRRVKHPGTPAD